MSVKVKAYAKVNLTLSLTGEENGYHMLESLVCTVDLYDLIKVKKRRDKLISIQMHGQNCENIPYENNNAVKAAQMYIDAFGTDGADITVFKNIPVGAGLGGSSADAAGVLLALARLYGKGSEGQLKDLADKCGSDTGYLLTGGYAILTGRGERVEKLPGINTRLSFLMLVPQSGVSTAECYRLSDGFGRYSNETSLAVQALKNGDIAQLGKCLSNDLYPPACAINADVKEAYGSLSEFSPSGVCMTGSGSGVFALFESFELCAWAQSRYRGPFRTLLLKSVPCNSGKA